MNALSYVLLLVRLCGAAALTKPNVLFIIVDDLRPALGVYGDPNAHTPNIDKLAKSSYVFNNAFAQQSLCAPSRTSLLTSRRPDSLHLYDFSTYWRHSVGNFSTLPQFFKEQGYNTQSVGKVFHPGATSNFTDDYPYSWSTPPFHPKTEIYKEAKVCVEKNGKLARNLICPVVVEEQPGGTLPDLESLQRALQFVDNKSEPFFLAVGFHKPHIPFKFPAEYLGIRKQQYTSALLVSDYHPLEKIVLPRYRIRPPLMPAVAWAPFLDVKSRDDMKKLNISFPFGAMPDSVTRKIIQSYNAATTYIDDLIGTLLREINKNNTIIVLTSDHGWSRGEHGEFSKYSNFDVATQVPLIIFVPDANPKEIFVDQMVELVDIFPTLVELTKIAPSTMQTCNRNGSNWRLCTEGRSLAPIMVQTRDNRMVTNEKKAVFSQYPRPWPFPTQAPDSDRPKLNEINVMGYSIRTPQYRYTEWVQFNHSSFKCNWGVVYGKELYDHQIDPLETLNLAERKEMTFITKILHKQLILGWRYA